MAVMEEMKAGRAMSSKRVISIPSRQVGICLDQAFLRKVDFVDAGDHHVVYAVKVFRGKVGGGCTHEIGAVRDGGVSGDEEDARVATNAIYSFDDPTAVWCL